MPLPEITGGKYRGKAPTNFSEWHRTNLPEWCYMTDGDYFLQAKIGGKLSSVAYVEEIEVEDVDAAMLGSYPIWPSKDALCREIKEKMKIQSFIVYHNPQCTDFLVFSYTDKTYRRMTKDEYKLFEIDLRRDRAC